MESDNRSRGTRLRHAAEYVSMWVLGCGLRALPRRARWSLGKLAGSLLFALDARHRAVTLSNLDIAFGDSKTPQEKYTIARDTFRHFGTMLFEMISLGNAPWRKMGQLVEFEGVELYERARAKGRGVLMVGAHYGNWEIHAVAHGFRFKPMSVVARQLDNPHYNRWLERIRNMPGNGVIYKQQALTQVMRSIKDGETVGVVVDQNVTLEDGIFIDFFGRKAASTPVASLIGLKTGAVLVPVFAFPLPNGRYRCVYEQPIDPEDYANIDRDRAVFEMTQQCAKVLENYVRRNPQFWLWMHRRWKTRPLEETEEDRATPAERLE